MVHQNTETGCGFYLGGVSGILLCLDHCSGFCLLFLVILSVHDLFHDSYRADHPSAAALKLWHYMTFRLLALVEDFVEHLKTWEISTNPTHNTAPAIDYHSESSGSFEVARCGNRPRKAHRRTYSRHAHHVVV